MNIRTPMNSRILYLDFSNFFIPPKIITIPRIEITESNIDGNYSYRSLYRPVIAMVMTSLR